MSKLFSIIETLQELKRMHQLNLELLEQLDVVCKWIVETDTPIPNKEKFATLLNKTQALLKELYLPNTPKILQYTKLSDDSYHDKDSDDKLPVPSNNSEHSDRRYFSIRPCITLPKKLKALLEYHANLT